MTEPRLFIASGIFHPEPGGPATYLHELLPALLKRGWEIRALTFSDSAGPHGEPYPVTRITRQFYPLRMGRYAAASLPLVRWASVVYAHTLGLPLLGPRRAPRVIKIVGDLAWERAVRRGWIPQGEDIDVFQTNRRYSPIVLADRDRCRREAASYDAVIVPSGYLGRMVAGWGVDEAKIRVIYNALPPEYSAASETQAEARARLGLDASRPIVLTVGRLLPWKGVDHLAVALQAVPEAELIVAGDGPALEAARAAAQAAGTAGRVRFLGRVGRGEMPLWMRAADYVALYSGYEGLSHTLLESLRAGTPVIASDRGGNPEVVEHGVNGLLVPHVDREALAAALAQAFAPGMRQRLAAGATAPDERFTFARMLSDTDAELRRWLR